MAFCNNTQVIQQQECIGDSLFKINNNFANIDAGLCSTSTAVDTLSTSIANLIATSIANAIPVGAIMPFATQVAPTGWLIADGVAVPNGFGTVQGVTANFAGLYTALGSTFGAAGKLPDLRGNFIRGVGGSSGTFGAYQAPYAGTFTWQCASDDGDAQSGQQRSVRQVWLNGIYSADNGSGGPVTIPITPGDTRPSNIALLYCIKY